MKMDFSQPIACTILLSISFQLIGCASSQSKELDRNRRLWQQSNIVNYRIVGSSNCGAVIIKVQDGKAISIEQAFKSQVGINLNCFEKFNTVDKIFDYVQQELEKGNPTYVKYNKELGCPEEIKTGSSFDTENRITMEFQVSILNSSKEKL